MRTTFRTLISLCCVLAMVAVSCGSDADTIVDAATSQAEEAVTQDAAPEPADDTSDDAMEDEETMEEDAMDEEEPAAEEAMEEEEEEDAMAEEEEAPAPLGTADTDGLVIWADERRAEPLQEVAAAFTDATGIEVLVEFVVFEDLRDRVNQAAPAGEGPDIFVGAHDWTGELAANGIITSIDVSASQDQFLSSALAAFNFAGENYAVPYVTEAVGLYRNTDLAPEAPATFDELVAGCAELAVDNCLVVPGGGAGADAYHNYPFLSAFGGNIFAFDSGTGFDSSQVGLDSPESIKGIEYLADRVADGTVASTDYGAAQSLFLEGEAAYWITGPWELGNMRDQSDINFDVSIIPQIGDAPTQPFVGSQGFFLSAFTDNELLASSFLLDFVATDEAMQALFDADPRGTAWASVQAGLTDDPQTQAFAESAGNGIPMPNIPQMGSVWGPLGDNLLLVRNGEATAAEAMSVAAEAVRTAIAG